MCKDIDKYLSTLKHNTLKDAFIKQTTYAKTFMSWRYVCEKHGPDSQPYQELIHYVYYVHPQKQVGEMK